MQNRSKSIFIFTLSFPYFIGGENTFLQYEIDYIKNRFDEIVIFPFRMDGDKQELSNEINIDNSISKLLTEKKYKSVSALLQAALSKYYFKELFYNKLILKGFNKIFNSLFYLSKALIISKELTKILEKQKDKDVILYTYWCTYATLGVALANKKFNFSKVITRAHGIDLYEVRNQIYFRKLTIELLDRFYTISEDGVKYLSLKYKSYISKFTIARLGIRGSNKVPKNKKNINLLRIISCSNIDANKQVSLIFSGINKYHQINEDKNIEWHHFGDGLLKSELENEIKTNNSSNFKIFLHGYLSNKEILYYYENNYVDFFVNASISEGIPVSIMEAQSFSIPIIAPAVGGIPEIVNNNNGRLLKKTCTSDDIANAINELSKDQEQILTYRDNSYSTWEEKFNADKNYSLFAEEMQKII